MNKTARFVAAGATAVALAGGIGAGIAWADPSSPAPTPSSPTSSSPTSSNTASPSAAPENGKKTDHKKRPLAARALHGEVTLAGKQHRVVVFQRGTVDQVSDTSITVTSVDGFDSTYVVTAQTKVRMAKKVVTIGDVKTGDRVRVSAVKDGSTLTAKGIGDRGPK